MNKHDAPFLLNLGFIVQESIGFTREFSFEFPFFKIQDDLELYDLCGEIKISRTSEGLMTQGKFDASHFTTCSRCLDDFKEHLYTEFAELFFFNKNKASESELIVPDNGEVDFEPIIREYFLLEMQISPVCSPTCKGLCPICGEKIIGEECIHDDDEIDPRFSVLKSLLDDE